MHRNLSRLIILFLFLSCQTKETKESKTQSSDSVIENPQFYSISDLEVERGYVDREGHYIILLKNKNDSVLEGFKYDSRFFYGNLAKGFHQLLYRGHEYKPYDPSSIDRFGNQYLSKLDILHSKKGDAEFEEYFLAEAYPNEFEEPTGGFSPFYLPKKYMVGEYNSALYCYKMSRNFPNVVPEEHLRLFKNAPAMKMISIEQALKSGNSKLFPAAEVRRWKFLFEGENGTYLYHDTLSTDVSNLSEISFYYGKPGAMKQLIVTKKESFLDGGTTRMKLKDDNGVTYDFKMPAEAKRSFSGNITTFSSSTGIYTKYRLFSETRDTRDYIGDFDLNSLGHQKIKKESEKYVTPCSELGPDYFTQ